MPRASRSPRLTFDTLDEVAAVLRANGGRFSAPRRTVLEALFAVDGPVSAEHIAGGLEGRTRRLELTSVYRTLERLEELGVVRHVHIGHGPGLYALTRSGDTEYVACEGCHAVTIVDAARLDSARAAIRAAVGYEARFSHFPIVGLCPRCAVAFDQAAGRGADAVRRPPAAAPGGDHLHDEPQVHEHVHGHGAHAHPHTTHDHPHLEHEHGHSHGDRLHAHSHVHEEGLVDRHHQQQ